MSLVQSLITVYLVANYGITLGPLKNFTYFILQTFFCKFYISVDCMVEKTFFQVNTLVI